MAEVPSGDYGQRREPLDEMTTEEVAALRRLAILAPAGVGLGARLIAEERLRQVEREGWTPEHDDEHIAFEMAQAAACYLDVTIDDDPLIASLNWPWHEDWWKPSADPIRNLVRAGALIAAEVDRLHRAAKNGSTDSARGDG